MRRASCAGEGVRFRVRVRGKDRGTVRVRARVRVSVRVRSRVRRPDRVLETVGSRSFPWHGDRGVML